MKTNNSSKQQRQLIESLLPPVPNFPTNSSSSPLPFPEQRLLRTLHAPALAVSQESGAEQVAVRRRPGHPFSSALTLRHTGFPYGRVASAAPLLHHPTPFPNPPLRPFCPKHTRTHASRLPIVLQARLWAQDRHKPSKPQTCRPDASPRGPQRHHRHSCRFCAASFHLDTGADSPHGGTPGRAGRS